MILFMLALLLILPQLAGCVVFSHHLSLDVDNKYKMWWMFDEKNITIKVEVATTGWIAWGISPNGKMHGSDIVLGWKTKGKYIKMLLYYHKY